MVWLPAVHPLPSSPNLPVPRAPTAENEMGRALGLVMESFHPVSPHLGCEGIAETDLCEFFLLSTVILCYFTAHVSGPS